MLFKRKRRKTAIVVHIYHWDAWQEIATRLKQQTGEYALYLTLDIASSKDKLQQLKKAFPAAKIRLLPNKGMDILPFLSLIPELINSGYQQVLKLHTKKGITEFGDIWRQNLLDALLSDSHSITNAESAFKSNLTLKLLGPAAFFLSGKKLMLENQAMLELLCNSLLDNSLPDEDWGFFAGSMFWSRPQIWQKLAYWVNKHQDLFCETYHQDGLLVHAIERYFGLACYQYKSQIGLLHPSCFNEQQYVLQITAIKQALINQVSSQRLCHSYASLESNYELFQLAGLTNNEQYQDFLLSNGFEPSIIKKIDLIKHYWLIGQFSRGRKYALAWDLHCQNSHITWQKLVDKQRVKDLISIVIPVYGQLELTKLCVQSLHEYTQEYNYEVILVDNGSDSMTTNGLVTLTHQYSKLRLIKQAENKNFALGSNLGFAEAKGEYSVFLNNDTQVTSGWLAPLIARIKQDDVYAAQPQLLYPDGTIQCIGVVFSEHSNLGYPIYQGLEPEHCNAQRPREFQAITAACMAIKSQLFAQIKGFDPIYINGQEDIDLCLRLKALTKKKAAYVPESKVFHHESKTPGRSEYRVENRYVFYHYWGSEIESDDFCFYQEDSLTGINITFDNNEDPIVRSIKPSFNKYKRRNNSMDNLYKIKEANIDFVEQRYEEAARKYKMAAVENPELEDYMLFNMSLINSKAYDDFSCFNSSFFSKNEIDKIKSQAQSLGVWDGDFYLNVNEDVKNAGCDPYEHFINYGWKENRNPAKEFDVSFYIEQSNIKYVNPIDHYIKVGKEKGYYINNYKAVFKKFEDYIDTFNSDYEYKINTNKPIDILIPVYNGYEYLDPLFESVLNNTTLSYRLIVADDCSPDGRVLPCLEKWEKRFSNFILIKNETNLGFVGSVNNMVRFIDNHFVLLNTDTEVPDGWLNRLMYPIFEMNNIATTTPYTNSGTICSFPTYLEDNEIIEGMNVNEVDSFFRHISLHKNFIEIPTGVGFCMGVNKNVVDNIGMFDTIFGKGYGEENDFCQRAIKIGYKNIHIPNLYVYHKHGGSFTSEAKQKLVEKNLKILNSKHSNYSQDIARATKNDELSVIRKVTEFKIKNKDNKVVLFFDHGLGGGAVHYLDERVKKLKYQGVSSVTIRNNFRNDSLEFMLHFDDKIEIIESLSSNGIVEFALKNLRIDEIFLNSLVGFKNVGGIIKDILNFKTSEKLIIPLHDYYPICPSFTLLNDDGVYCGVPKDLNVCSRCIKNNNREFKKYTSENDIVAWRYNWGELISYADEILAFSQASIDILLKAYPNAERKTLLIPHDISGRFSSIYEDESENVQEDDTFVIGVLGGINEAKGLNVLQELVDHIVENNINARVVVFGATSHEINSPAFKKTGGYKIENLPELIKSENVSVFLIPSIWPETFSYTTDEVMQLGYPLVVFDLGAPAERVRKYTKGTVILRENLNSYIKELVESNE
ncbi:glycosyltransferase [Vibrio metschnikovii]|uniref:glycosyltransferase n=1 Tax=Vibrio metschnikovii TaxID=28172 RepID=UPI0032ECD8EC